MGKSNERRKLLKLLRNLGYKKLRTGKGSHQTFSHPNYKDLNHPSGRPFITVPRKVSNQMFKIILKQIRKQGFEIE